VLVLATHAIKTGGTATAGMEGTGEKHNAGAEVANQSRKVTATTQSAIVAGQATGRGFQKKRYAAYSNDNRQSLVQQLRGYVDEFEGELLNATDETAQLREQLQKKETELRDIVNYLTKRLDEAETTVEKLTKALEVEKRREIEQQKRIDNLKGMYSSARKGEDNALAKLSSTQEEVYVWQSKANKLERKLGETKQTLEFNVEELRKAKSSEASIQDGLPAQFGEILLVPLQSPTWCNELRKSLRYLKQSKHQSYLKAGRRIGIVGDP
jgi:chromosome segregation ATPase